MSRAEAKLFPDPVPKPHPMSSDFLVVAGDLSTIRDRDMITMKEQLAAREDQARKDRALTALDGAAPPQPSIFN